MAESYSPLLISLKTAILATAVTVILGILAARLVIRFPEKAQWLTDGILTLPLVLPPTVIGFILLMIFGKNSPLGQALLQLGIRVVFSWSGAVIAAIVVSFPLMYRTTKAAFEQMDQNLIDAGRTMGLSERYIFWQIRGDTAHSREQSKHNTNRSPDYLHGHSGWRYAFSHAVGSGYRSHITVFHWRHECLAGLAGKKGR